jgi:Nif-specific regulatory protein
MAPKTLKGFQDLLKRRTLEMTTLYEVSKILASSISQKFKINTALKVFSHFLGLKRVSIMEYDSEKKELRIVYAHGFTREEVKNGIFPVDKGILGSVINNNVPEIVLENPTKIWLPMKIQNRLYGVFYIEREFTDELTINEELKFLNVANSIFLQAIHLAKEAEETKNKLLRENEALREQLEKGTGIHGIIGISKQMQEVISTIKRVAPTDATVLIRGESGTGKELVANAIHSLSHRADKPFIKVNCPAIPDTLIEAELFGHEKGAFTGATKMRIGRFELANGGTIFLDEIGDLSLNLQSKLLRFLQESAFERVGSSKTIKVDVRVIAATNRNLEKMMEEGTFRNDLYYRLNIVPIFLPPLRERKEDIPLLVEHFLEKFNRIHNKSVKLTEQALKVLIEYPWPGNVRELENCIHRIVVLSNSNLVDSKDIPLPVIYPELKEEKQLNSVENSEKSMKINEVERELILKALKDANGKLKEAAKILGLSLRQLTYRLKKYKIVKSYKIV